ncbi:zinc-dependent metalloprotease family protein [Flavobacteriaceae bacterium S356]|uniref:Zinc-dependent metalloprotease family protein n=1 Tax=Asprobacillus argus TaxID=3076534 RepID=A0ABU3LF84_9FLAO|nr:zinc-dependent metalloprotease family protein [Flavobacteriaceae bacterium S356]
MKLKLPLLVIALALALSTSTHAQKNAWTKTTTIGNLNKISIKDLNQNESETFVLNATDFKNQLKGAPLRGQSNRTSSTNVLIPDEKGSFLNFTIFEAPVFSPSLSAKFPEIKSYIGYGSHGEVLRMSVSPKGVQTMITYTNRSATFMQPVKNQPNAYIAYNKESKHGMETDEFICSTANEIKKESPRSNLTGRDANDQTLRKFRLAMSVNGEYTAYHGGTVAGALAGINATIARVNAVFEVDMAVTFEVQDFPDLIYTDAATDPYTSIGAWNGELQSTLTSEIGEAAYDIGHMFGASGGGGSAGCIGCVCVDGSKGSGKTSPADGVPEGDTFDIDYVAHEIGHQMGANHTFSHQSEGSGVNVEPGSGSTIMGYAGITSSNVQQNSDAYFHYVSIKQILDNLVTRTCWQNNSPLTLTNNPPVADAGANYTIPQGTAYVLRGSATDADSGDTLTYCWEENDDGVVTIPSFGPTTTTGAQTRSLSPTTKKDRYIPKLSRIVAGSLTETSPSSGSDWETVSTVGRTLNWALTVRDRQPTATGLHGQSSYDLMAITVDAASGPFAVTSTNNSPTWDTGTQQTVTWDVAGTDNAGTVNCQMVNIKLSTDGGLTFPITLVSNTPNDGSHTLVVPENPTTQGRLMVEAADNIFLAVNTANFTINSTTPTFLVENNTGDLSACNSGGGEAQYTLNFNFVNGFSENVTFSTTGEPAGSLVEFSPTSISADGNVVMTISNLDGVTAQSYTIDVTATSTSVTQNVSAGLTVYSSTFSALNLTSPANGATAAPLVPTLTWDAESNATSYDVEISTDSGFGTLFHSGNATTNSYVSPTLTPTTQYYWRVRPKNSCATGSYTSASFTTDAGSYCASTFNETANSEWILRVQFNTIDKTSRNDHDPNPDDGYQDFTAESTNVVRGDTHNIAVTMNTAGFQDHCYVFIDWNQDFEFDINTERYNLGTMFDDEGTLDLDIVVPNNAVFGSTRMRVIIEYTHTNEPHGEGPCTADHNSGWGETEDYTIIVDNTTSVKDTAFEGFNLFPNPSNGDFNLQFDTVTSDDVQLQLFDLTGRLVQEVSYKNVAARFSENVSFKDVSNGVYLLKIKNGTTQTTRKLIIE